MSFLINPIKRDNNGNIVIKKGYAEFDRNDELDLIYTADNKDFIIIDNYTNSEYLILGEVVNQILDCGNYEEIEIINLISIINRSFVSVEEQFKNAHKGKLTQEAKKMLDLSLDDLTEILLRCASNYNYDNVKSVLETMHEDEIVNLFNGNKADEKDVYERIEYYPGYPGENITFDSIEESEYGTDEERYKHKELKNYTRIG